MLECIASVMIATEPVTTPATTLSRISAELETIETAAARDFARPAPAARVARRARSAGSHASSARAARPRWLIASFSAGASSAIVRPSGPSSGRNDRVVAEAALAARAPAPGGRCSGPRRARSRPRRDRRRRARTRSASALPGGRLGEQLREVLRVGRVLAGVAGGAHARRAAERRGLDPRVVGDRRRARGGRGGARLEQRVGREGVARSRAGARRRRAARRPRGGPAARANSRSLWALRVASTSLTTPMAARLRSAQDGDPALGQREQLVEVRAGERRALGGRLHLDAGRPRRSSRRWRRPRRSSPRGSRGRAAARRRRCRTRPPRPCPVSGARVELALVDEPRARQRERDVAAGDRRAARAAVGLEHVAVDVDRALAERLEVDDAAQRAADQPLDLDRAPVGAARG